MTTKHAPHSSRFGDPSVAQRYHFRPSYPSETYTILLSLCQDHITTTVLDVGCGTGDIARHLAAHVQAIDAIDPSSPMIEAGKAMPGGNAANIRWVVDKAETHQTETDYGLITAGQSLHWMGWTIVLPYWSLILAPGGMLAIVDVLFEPTPPWQGGYIDIVKRYSNQPDYQQHVDMMTELEEQGLFRPLGSRKTVAIPTKQSVNDYVQAQHARSSLSLDTMTGGQAQRFGEEMRALLEPHALNGELTVHVTGHVVWGKPLNGRPAG